VGIYDSSRTRIAPVFGRLQCLDPSGRLWLQGAADSPKNCYRGRGDHGA
jgi:hypothetical protein